jgi:hypothetical protein
LQIHAAMMILAVQSNVISYRPYGDSLIHPNLGYNIAHGIGGLSATGGLSSYHLDLQPQRGYIGAPIVIPAAAVYQE